MLFQKKNFYGGVGNYVHNIIVDVYKIDELKIGKWCHRLTRENESILKIHFLQNNFCWWHISPSKWKCQPFCFWPWSPLETISGGIKVILAGDINIDIKYDYGTTVQCVTTLLSCRFLLYIILPTRITEYSETCIDHLFVKLWKTSCAMYSDILTGMLYCDISDHLPCFVSLKCTDYINMNERKKVRLYGERKYQRSMEKMTTK